MRNVLLWFIVVGLFAAGVWFFHMSSRLLLEGSYLAGILEIGVGLATLRGGVEMARLAILVEREDV